MVPFDGPRNLTRDGAELSLEGMTMDCASPQPANRVLSECSDRVGALPFEEITCYHPIAIRYIIHCNTAVGNGTATAMMVTDMLSDPSDTTDWSERASAIDSVVRNHRMFNTLVLVMPRTQLTRINSH